MGDAKHTPGPWTMEFEHGHMSGGLVSRGSDVVAEVYGANNGAWRNTDDCGEAEFEANARLIAAAPDLVEALKALTPFLDDLDDATDGVGVYPEVTCSRRCRDAVAKARAALSKAGV